MRCRTAELLQPNSRFKCILRLPTGNVRSFKRPHRMHCCIGWILHAVGRFSDALVLLDDSAAWLVNVQHRVWHELRFGYILYRVDVCDSTCRVLQSLHIPWLVLPLSAWHIFVCWGDSV